MKKQSNFTVVGALRDLWAVVKALAAIFIDGCRNMLRRLSEWIENRISSARSARREKRLIRQHRREEALAKRGAEKKLDISEKKKAKKGYRLWQKRQRQSRSRNEYRNRAIWRTVGHLVLFTLLYWGLIILHLLLNDAGSPIAEAVEDILRGLLEIIGIFYWVYDNLEPILVIGYIIGMIGIPLRAVARTAGHLDRIYEAAATVPEPQLSVPDLPRDVRDVGTLLREIKVNMTQSEQSAKEAEQRKNDLVVYLAHDLKTPLASIIGYLSLLEESPELPVEQRAKYTSITLNKAYRLEQLINEFFDITRFNLQSVELEKNRIDLCFMLRQIADEFYPVLEEKELEISFALPAHIPVTGDADKLARVFDNLLRNAVSYSYPGTCISIVARLIESNEVELRFRNTGDEIPQHTLDRLFEKFFRADTSRRTSTGGSGLGLAIAKQIVELHGGTISASSSADFTEFTILLPIYDGGSDIVRIS